MNRKLAAAVGLVLAGALMLAASACTDSADTDPTPVQTWKITPASGTQPPASPTPAATSASTQTPGTSAAGTTITITASNLLFDKTTITAPAGAVTIELVNKDGGVPHNIHFFKGSSATGESVGMTPITTGPVTDTVTLTFEKGDYYYHCDVHPTTMTGKLTVS